VSAGLLAWLIIGWAGMLLFGSGLVALGAALEARMKRRARRNRVPLSR
jgi:hypothetical protein